jgi:dTDP-4-amino-4,6-dideoxygalactose transaminase
MTVPFLNLHSTYKELEPEIELGVKKFFEDGQYILGTPVQKFENEFANFTESKFCVGVADGLDSIFLALKALEIGIGDEVIVPTNTFIATWLAVSQVGAKIVPVEPDIDTCLIDLKKIEEKITSRTKAIIPVHLYGNPVDMDYLIGLANKYRLRIIEDAAQAHGAQINSKKIGSHGDIVCWSFYPGKNLGCYGDGGAITTNNFDLAEKIRTFRNYGSKVKYVHEIKGFNSRIDTLQAVFLSIKLQKITEWNRRRENIANYYLENLSDTPLVLPKVRNNAVSSWHLFVIRFKERDNLQEYLSNNGIQTLIHYPIPPHKQNAYSNDFYEDFPIAEEMARTVLSLPIGPHLEFEKVQYVVETIKKYFK